MLSHRASTALLLATLLAAAAACDGSDNVVSDGDRDGGGDCGGTCVDFSDAALGTPDAGPGSCTPAGPACNNCTDDDGDSLVDGADPECTGSLDDDEGSFGTGISGDNVDAKTQDCFFDGNSGGGDDKCKFHTCCLLAGPCPEALQPPRFDPAECVMSTTCINNCAPLAPPGCDCFGCCTICNQAGCFDVLTNPAIAPNCQAETVDDATACPRCTKAADCGGGDCTAGECQLCPGQTADDLPASCGGDNACPAGRTTCAAQADCRDDEYCSSGCCIAVIQ
jgi:hypothetical protein